MPWSYQRHLAVAYAARWWDGFNPAYPALADDCTNFVSQCLAAGGVPQDPAPSRAAGWWYRHRREGWSYSWAVSEALYRYLLGAGRAAATPDPAALAPGDLIFYDWDGHGRHRHTTLVVAVGPGGPQVASHTRARFGAPWSLTDSPAWTPKTRYTFLRLVEGMA